MCTNPSPTRKISVNYDNMAPKAKTKSSVRSTIRKRTDETSEKRRGRSKMTVENGGERSHILPSIPVMQTGHVPKPIKGNLIFQI